MGLIDQYKEKGFVLEKGFFRQQEIDRIREEAKEIFALQMVRLGIVASPDN